MTHLDMSKISPILNNRRCVPVHNRKKSLSNFFRPSGSPSIRTRFSASPTSTEAAPPRQVNIGTWRLYLAVSVCHMTPIYQNVDTIVELCQCCYGIEHRVYSLFLLRTTRHLESIEGSKITRVQGALDICRFSFTNCYPNFDIRHKNRRVSRY